MASCDFPTPVEPSTTTSDGGEVSVFRALLLPIAVDLFTTNRPNHFAMEEAMRILKAESQMNKTS